MDKKYIIHTTKSFYILNGKIITKHKILQAEKKTFHQASIMADEWTSIQKINELSQNGLIVLKNVFLNIETVNDKDSPISTHRTTYLLDMDYTNKDKREIYDEIKNLLIAYLRSIFK